jgi:hypothetical protein
VENMRVLTVISYGENVGESYRVTLQAMNIGMVTSPEALVQRQGKALHKALHKAVVKFLEEGGTAELYVSGPDLKILEEAVGFYGLDDDFIGPS